MESLEPKTLQSIVAYNQKARPGRSYLSMNLRELIVYGKRKLDGTPFQTMKRPDFLPTVTTHEVEHPNMTITKTGRRATLDGKNSHSIGLADKVQLLRTPTAGDGTHNHVLAPSVLKKKTTIMLSHQILMLPTPGAQDWKKRGPASKQRGVGEVVTDTQIGQGTGKKLRLQPAMTEWLMGFPEDWATLPLALQSGAEKPSKPTVTQ